MPKPTLTVISNESRKIRNSDRPFVVARYDRLTRKRILSPAEQAILDLIESAVEEISNATQGKLRLLRKLATDLRRSGLDGKRARLIGDRIRLIAVETREWGDDDCTHIVQILNHPPFPFKTPGKPRLEMPVSEFLENFTLCGYNPRLVIEGGKKVVILLDALGDELARFSVRDGDRLHARDLVEGFRIAEQQVRRR